MSTKSDSLTETGVPDKAASSAYKALFSNRSFRFWFASSFTSSLGDWMGFVALTSMLTKMFNDQSSQLFAVGGLLMIRLLPSAVFGPVAGVIADRYDRRKVLFWTDMARAALFGMITFANDLVALFALTFIVECVSLLFGAAKDSSLPQVVENKDHMTEANQLNLLCSYGTLPLGAVSTAIMTGMAVLVQGFVTFPVDALRLALGFNALSFFLSGLLLFQVQLIGEEERKAARKNTEEESSVLQEIREGLDFIRDFPLLRSLIIGVVGTFFAAGMLVGLGPVFVNSDLGQPAESWSVMLSVFGAGLITGIAALVPITKRFNQEVVFYVALTITGVMAILSALSYGFTMALIVGAFLGASAGVAVVIGYTLLHEYTEEATRGRTFSLFFVATRLALFAALGIGPFVAGAIGSWVLPIGADGMKLSGVRVGMILGGVVALYFAIRTRTAFIAIHRGDVTPVKLSSAPYVSPGTFITFEGVEGAGKSTQIRFLAEALRNEGHTVVVSREPGGAETAEHIRELVLSTKLDVTDRTEALLMAAARADHVEKTIRPALDNGAVVLVDRYIDSSLAYQGHARGLGVQDIAEVNRWAVNGVWPDAVVLLNLDPATGMERVHARSTAAGTDRMERESLDFHQAVANGYRRLARENADRYVIVEATGTPESVARHVRDGLNRWLPVPVEDDTDIAPVSQLLGRGGPEAPPPPPPSSNVG